MTSPDPHTGDRRRFEVLYDAHYQAILRYIVRRMPSTASKEDASDVTAEVFLTAWRRIAETPGPPHDLPWLYGVARRTLDRHRRASLPRRRLWWRLRGERTVVDTRH